MFADFRCSYLFPPNKQNQTDANFDVAQTKYKPNKARHEKNYGSSANRPTNSKCGRNCIVNLAISGVISFCLRTLTRFCCSVLMCMWHVFFTYCLLAPFSIETSIEYLPLGSMLRILVPIRQTERHRIHQGHRAPSLCYSSQIAIRQFTRFAWELVSG